jgi:hypothetical protein
MTLLALSVVSPPRSNSVAFGGEADTNRQARLAGSVDYFKGMDGRRELGLRLQFLPFIQTATCANIFSGHIAERCGFAEPERVISPPRSNSVAIESKRTFRRIISMGDLVSDDSIPHVDPLGRVGINDLEVRPVEFRQIFRR